MPKPVDPNCRCVADHRPVPLEMHVHHVWPLGDGGPNVTGNMVTLCPTTHSSAHDLLRAIKRSGGTLTYRRAQELYTEPVSRYAYSVARLGWLRFKAQALG